MKRKEGFYFFVDVKGKTDIAYWNGGEFVTPVSGEGIDPHWVASVNEIMIVEPVAVEKQKKVKGDVA